MNRTPNLSMEEIELSFDVQNIKVAGTATITQKELPAQFKSKSWIVLALEASLSNKKILIENI